MVPGSPAAVSPAERPDAGVEAEDVGPGEQQCTADALGQLAGLLYHREQPRHDLAQYRGQPGAQQPAPGGNGNDRKDDDDEGRDDEVDPGRRLERMVLAA